MSNAFIISYVQHHHYVMIDRLLLRDKTLKDKAPKIAYFYSNEIS